LIQKDAGIQVIGQIDQEFDLHLHLIAVRKLALAGPSANGMMLSTFWRRRLALSNLHPYEEGGKLPARQGK